MAVKPNVIAGSIQVVVVTSLVLWIGSVIFGGDPCEKAQARLQKARYYEQQQRKEVEAGADTYSLIKVMRLRQNAELKAGRACQKQLFE